MNQTTQMGQWYVGYNKLFIKSNRLKDMTSIYSISRPVAIHPGGGLNLDGWNTILSQGQGMVGLSIILFYIMAETRSLAPIAVDG